MMHTTNIVTFLIAAVLIAVGALSAAVPSATAPPALGRSSRSALSGNGTEASGNATAEGGIPFLGHIKCIPNFMNGTALTPDEKFVMLGCYPTLWRWGWISRMVNCPQTNRYFQSWGHHWNSPEDCMNACHECFVDAVADGAANLRCFKYEGITARCHFTYE
ncbi:hypothetical protein F4804DRAFT_347727 [Jackrogersella minutella]|nr:hypothetical protein F4804DRAFT_347727 [Jackrogersella minutella]